MCAASPMLTALFGSSAGPDVTTRQSMLEHISAARFASASTTCFPKSGGKNMIHNFAYHIALLTAAAIPDTWIRGHHIRIAVVRNQNAITLRRGLPTGLRSVRFPVDDPYCPITAFSCTQTVSVPANSRFYRATRLLLIRARISFCCSDARFITFE
jgi:hypothetical protein